MSVNDRMNFYYYRQVYIKITEIHQSLHSLFIENSKIISCHIKKNIFLPQ